MDRNLLSIGMTMREGMRRDYKDFSLRMSSSLSKWVGVLKKPLLGFFFLNDHTYLVGMRGIYTSVRKECKKSVFPKTGLAGNLTSRLN